MIYDGENGSIFAFMGAVLPAVTLWGNKFEEYTGLLTGNNNVTKITFFSAYLNTAS